MVGQCTLISDMYQEETHAKRFELSSSKTKKKGILCFEKEFGAAGLSKKV